MVSEHGAEGSGWGEGLEWTIKMETATCLMAYKLYSWNGTEHGNLFMSFRSSQHVVSG